VLSFFHFAIVLLALLLLAQSNSGELRLKITGSDGQPIKASIDLSSDAVQFHRTVSAADSGLFAVRNLAFAEDRLQVHEPDFVGAPLGAQLHKTDKLALNFQADGEDLNNCLNIIDFGGLFSGNAVGPP
jgi:hypothetical protein